MANKLKNLLIHLYGIQMVYFTMHHIQTSEWLGVFTGVITTITALGLLKYDGDKKRG